MCYHSFHITPPQVPQSIMYLQKDRCVTSRRGSSHTANTTITGTIIINISQRLTVNTEASIFFSNLFFWISPFFKPNKVKITYCGLTPALSTWQAWTKLQTRFQTSWKKMKLHCATHTHTQPDTLIFIYWSHIVKKMFVISLYMQIKPQWFDSALPLTVEHVLTKYQDKATEDE